MVHFLNQYSPRGKNISIVELGGANSFMVPILRPLLSVSQYHIIDNHPSNGPIRDIDIVRFHARDILDGGPMPQADLVFSIGLIEHFSPENTRRAIQAHMDCLKPSGILLMTFPTPTWLYKVSRRLLEICGIWIFHDERALRPEEVESEASQYGTVLDREVLWPLILTQTVLVMKRDKS